MKASEWIDRVKKSKGWDSDYRVAKELGLSPNTISTYRSARSHSMNEKIAVKVADALGIDPAYVVLDQHAERSKHPVAKAAYRRVADTFFKL